jgi:alpha-L-fucosidase
VQTVAVPASGWFGQCRYGMFVHANIASVPAFAPVHEYADWYWAFLDPKPDMVLHPSCPLPEVVAWHHEHFGDRAFDDFIPELTFAQFDADWYAQLLDDAGMRYLVHVTKHHDGFCWWDTGLTSRNSMRLGPKRDIVAELADAVRRRGHVFGCYYSLLDWAHDAYPDQARYVDAYMRPQIRELMTRYEPALLWGDGHWGHPAAHWRADDIISEAREYAAAHGFEVVCNDRFWASSPDFEVFEYDVPAAAPDRPWELCRGLGYSFCVNRNERVDDHLSAREVVAMLVETVAKGGNLLLNVGPNADGTLADIQARVLRESGEWVRAHADAIHGSTTFDGAGGGAHWYTRASDAVHAFDLSSAAEPCFSALHGVTSVTTPDGTPLTFREDVRGTTIDARASDRHPFGTRYLVSCDTTRRIPPSLVARTDAVAALLAGARPGDVVDVPPGRYHDERFPITVPAGVTLRGASARSTTIDAGGRHALVLQTGATLEQLTVTGGAPGYMMIPATCITGSGDRITIADCVVQSVLLSGGEGHVVANDVIAGGKVWCMGADRVTVRGNYQYGLRWGAGIEVNGGDGHLIEYNECRDDLCAIRCTSTAHVDIKGNRYETRWFGIYLLDARDTCASRNQAWHTMRAVDIEGGRDNRIDTQLAERCDSGVVVEGGADGTLVTDSWLHDCRLGLLVWGAARCDVRNVAITAPRDHAIVADRALDLDGNQIDGDTWTC